MRQTCWLILAAGCTQELTLEDFAPSAPDGAMRIAQHYGGCEDVELHIHNQDETRALFFNFDELATQARQRGSTIQAAITLPDPRVWVELQRGVRLLNYTCVGAPPPLPPRVDASLFANQGQVEITITPRPNGTAFNPLATAEMRFRDLAFVTGSGDVLLIPDMEIPSTLVGWTPP